MRKFVLFAIICLLLALPIATVQAAPPPDGPPGLERAIAAQEAHTDRLLNIPGVVGTAVGLGNDGLPAIKIYTERMGVAGLPKSLDGIPVKVVVTGMFHARYDPKDRQTRPVPIGVSTGHPDITAGTIGARVTDANDKVYALSNNHVYACENNADIGDSALQPGPIDGGTYPADEIGTLHDFVPLDFDGGDNIMDAAIALSSTNLLSNATLPDGYGVPGAVPIEAYIGQDVQKYGRTTGLTEGTVEDINVTVNVCYDARGVRCFKSARFVNQIAITPGTFSDGGDSGSLIVTNDLDKNPVGLLFAGSPTYTLANPIGPVLERFQVTIDSEPIDAPPSVSIVSPTEGSTVSGTVTVTADASDDNSVTQVEFFIGDFSIGVDKDGADGWSAPWDTESYNEGIHTVTATATDTIGQTDSDSIVVTVDNFNDSPVASFTYTCSGLVCNFDASGSDDPDGDIVVYDWNFGDGNTLSANIATATHTYGEAGAYAVTLTVTDNDGATGTESKWVTVSETAATMHVGDLDGSKKVIGKSGKWAVFVTVTIHDKDHKAVPSAMVSGTWSGDTSGTVSGISGDDGTVTFSTGNMVGGSSVTFTVDDVSDTLTYDPFSNHDDEGDSNGTSITVSRT